MAKNTTVLLDRLRPYVQAVFFLLFIYLFLRVAYPLQKNIITNVFFNFDPLVAFIMAITGSFFIYGLLASVVTVVVALVFGRLFCGWVCPLGTLFDLGAKIIPERKHQPPYGKGPYKNIKYYGLVFLVLSSIAGFSALLFFDPLVFLFRVVTLNVYPAVVLLANLGLDWMRPVAAEMGAFAFSTLSYEQPVYLLGLANLVLIALVIGLVYVERRFWCRNLCPLGAFLSVLSRYSVWGRKVSDACISCSKCARICPMNCIDAGFHETSLRECIQCERCASVCPVDAITFEFDRNTGQRFEHNPARRKMLASGAAGLLTAFTASAAASTKTVHGGLIRPPGTLKERDFLDACLRCGECMKICPTNGLQPTMLQSGFEGLFTPRLVPRIGGCEEECNLCGQICPTGAIRALPLEEKQYATLGNATIERNLCIAWEQLKVCLICDEVCPYDAIEFRMVTDEKGTLQRPFVIEDKCVGCGQCENACPVNGPAAIHVTPVNEVRKNEGSYITEKVRQLREVDDQETDFYEEYDATGTGGGAGEGGEAQPDSVPEQGFEEDEPPPGVFMNLD